MSEIHDIQNYIWDTGKASTILSEDFIKAGIYKESLKTIKILKLDMKTREAHWFLRKGRICIIL